MPLPTQVYPDLSSSPRLMSHSALPHAPKNEEEAGPEVKKYFSILKSSHSFCSFLNGLYQVVGHCWVTLSKYDVPPDLCDGLLDAHGSKRRREECLHCLLLHCIVHDHNLGIDTKREKEKINQDTQQEFGVYFRNLSSLPSNVKTYHSVDHW